MRYSGIGWRCLSVRQPWAWAIVAGHKPIENRDWETDYRGPLVIHASKTLGCEPRNFSGECDMVAYLAELEALPPEARLSGGFVGLVELRGCVRAAISPWFTGDVGLELRAIEQWPLIPWQGQRGIWKLTEDECHEVCMRLEAAGFYRTLTKA